MAHGTLLTSYQLLFRLLSLNRNGFDLKYFGLDKEYYLGWQIPFSNIFNFLLTTPPLPNSLRRRHQLKLHTEIVAVRQRLAKPITPYQSQKTAKVLPDTGWDRDAESQVCGFCCKANFLEWDSESENAFNEQATILWWNLLNWNDCILN